MRDEAGGCRTRWRAWTTVQGTGSWAEKRQWSMVLRPNKQAVQKIIKEVAQKQKSGEFKPSRGKRRAKYG